MWKKIETREGIYEREGNIRFRMCASCFYGHVHASKTGSSSSGIGDNSATVKQAESATVNRPLL